MRSNKMIITHQIDKTARKSGQKWPKVAKLKNVAEFPGGLASGCFGQNVR